MLSKTIKLGLTILFASALLAGCASNSTEAPVEAPAPTTSAPATSAPVDNTPVAPQLETVFYFEFDQSSLTPETRALLTAHAAALKASPRSIRLEGHADERGTREYNMALGERRALSVRDYLLSEGVSSPIEVVSYGEEKPADTASNEFAWQQNRRVELR
jgi:peptidoglycan-associated lipoprotein